MRKKGVRSPADTKISEEGGGGVAPGAKAEVPLQLMERTMVDQAVPLQPKEDYIRANLCTAACGGPLTEAAEYFLNELQLMESPTWSRFILKDCSPWEGPTLEQGTV